MSPWPWISSLGRASLEGGLLILGVWAISRAWRGLPAWGRSGLWWLASARLLLALAPLTPIAVPTPFPVTATWWPSAIAAPPVPVASPAPTVPSGNIGGSTPIGAPVLSSVQPQARRFDPKLAGIGLLLVWAAGVALRLIGMARQFLRVRGLRSAAEPAGRWVPPALSATGVRVALSADVPVPMVTGLWNPLVLLPAAMIHRPGADLRLAVAHELSHVRRGDLWLAWVPALAEAIFWFHPLASLCAREYVQACEEACDEDALRATGAQPYEYGRLLLALGVDRRWVGAGAMPFGSPSPSQLVRRLSMLKHFAPLKPHVRTAAVGLVCAFALVGLAPVRLVPAAGSAVASGVVTAFDSGGVSGSVTAEVPREALPSALEKDPPPADDPEVAPTPNDGSEDLENPDAEIPSELEDPDANEDVPPVPPVPPIPPVPPAPAFRPLVPRASMSPRSGLAPRARGYGYRYSYDTADDPTDRFAYVLVHGDDESMTGSGNTLDWREVRRLRAELGGDFLWVRSGDRKYLIQDPELLAQIEDAFAPQSEIGARQSRLGAAQSRLGAQQSRIGAEQSRIGEQQSEIGRRQGDVAGEMARRQARMRPTRDLEDAMSELSDQMEALGHEQERLGTRMEPLSRQQEELGAQMEALGREMERVSRTASRKVRSLIDQAIRDGEAKPLR